MKIAVISELTCDTLNYGNRLQAYALNDYIICNFNSIVDSLSLGFYYEKKVNYKILNRLYKKIFNKASEKGFFEERKILKFEKRLKKCRDFTQKRKTVEIASLEELKELKCTVAIVGSDVVWAQNEFNINRLKFLDFKLKKPFKKLSYAASFGENWIPKRNKKYIKKCLDDFEAISVREKSSLELLESIGVKGAIHVCDPTLLLTAEEWSSVSEPVQEITEKYIFVYLLGKDASQREAIKELAKQNDLKIATIPHANNVYDPVDDDFGDYNLMDASPENWIWLIENSEYVITDSFHGTVFSTIFSKKFLVTKRHWEQDINMRMTDFLDTIDEQDKFVDILTIDSLENFVWDYEKIHEKTAIFIEKSKDYLEKALTQ